MTGFAEALEAEIIDWAFGGQSFEAPKSSWFVGLHNGDPGDDGQSNEVSGNNYGRVGVSIPGGWDQPGDDTADNTNRIQFPQASGNWGQVQFVSLWDQSTDGVAYFVGELDTYITVQSGERPKFDSAELQTVID